MATGSSITTNDGTWVASRNPTGGAATIAGAGGATVYQGTFGTTGMAYTTILPFATPPPVGATLTNVKVTMTVRSDGSSSNPGVTHTSPRTAFQPLSDGTTFFDLYWGGLYGAGGVGDLPYDTADHTIVYDGLVYPGVSGGGGVSDYAGFVAGIMNLADPAIMVAGVQGADLTGYLVYTDPVVVEVDWELAGTIQPPLRQVPRTDGLGASSTTRHYPPSRSAQASNRRAGGYL